MTTVRDDLKLFIVGGFFFSTACRFLGGRAIHFWWRTGKTCWTYEAAGGGGKGGKFLIDLRDI